MRIVLPFDGSPSAVRAVDYVIDLAAHVRNDSVEVNLVNAQEAAPGLWESVSQDAADVASRLAASSRDAGARLLEKPLSALKKADIAAESAVVIGDPASVIASYVDKHRADAVIMGTRGLGPVGGLVLGSVASKVIHLVKVPVTLVK
jgi:nucleotide-binding universal stress UspA family protein